MTYLKVTLPDEAMAELHEPDILSTVYKELERFGYTPIPAGSAAAEANSYPLQPPGNVDIEPRGNARIVRVHASGVDLHDLFTAVLADLEQRHVYLTGEID